MAGGFVFDACRRQAAGSAVRIGGGHASRTVQETEFPAALDRVRALPAEKLAATVDFFGMMQMPDVTYLGFADNRSVHHRGQLAAYLRAMGWKVPAIYGDSADEPMPGV